MKPVRVEAGRALLTVGRPNTFYVVEAGTCSVLGDLGQVNPHRKIGRESKEHLLCGGGGTCSVLGDLGQVIFADY